MKGKLGGLFKGENQVGGFLNWNAEIILSEFIDKGDLIRKGGKWKVTAESYWLYDTGNTVIVRLYPDAGKGYWEANGIIISATRKLFDTLIHEPIEIQGDGVLEGKG